MPKQIWTSDRVVGEIQELEKSGVDLRHSSVQDGHKQLISAAIRYFGSWRSAVEAAGLNYAQLRQVSEAQRIHKIGKWSQERIVKEILNLESQQEDLRAIIVKNKHPALFSAAVSPRYFGNWRQALSAAGINYDSILSKSTRGRPRRTDVWHAGLILEKIRDLDGQGYDLGAENVSDKMPRLHRLATMRFGSWRTAVDFALKK